MKSKHSRGHIVFGIALAFVLASVTLIGWSARAFGEERKFTIMLAVPPKSVENYPAGIDLPNRFDVWDHYFDRTKPHIDSFAEYWEEISYGSVHVSGDVFGWVEVPWPILPQADDLDLPIDTPNIEGIVLPYSDLNRNGFFNKGEGEEIDQTRQMILIDYNGDKVGTATPNYPEEADVPTRGLVDFNPYTGRPVWTPGERFRDLNENGRYDALHEATRDGWGDSVSDCCESSGGSGCEDAACQDAVCIEMESCCDYTYIDPDLGEVTVTGEWTDECVALAVTLCDGLCSECEQDGEIEDGEFCDLDEDGVWDFPEPFEDFLVIYDSESSAPFNWVKLDPSDNNQNAERRAWAEMYIRANYPGDVERLLARCGNGQYDGPDMWYESGSETYPNPGSKMQQVGGGYQWVPNATSPLNLAQSPGGGMTAEEYEIWWDAYWVDKHEQLGLAATPTPAPPEWNPLIPNLVEFDPSLPSMSELPAPDSGDPRSFSPNAGGTTARVDQTCGPDADGIPCSADCDVEETPMCTPLCKPIVDTGDGCTEPLIEPANTGDGSVASWADDDGPILPDTLDTNGDGLPDYFDGPVEYDDLPSSIYHARSISGLGYGGDGRPGEVTSATNTEIYGQDIGAGNPNNPTGPDGAIPVGGPLSHHVHGTNGYDGGNVLNLEFLTWRIANSPEISTSSPVKGLACEPTSGGLVFAVDAGLDALLTIDPASAEHTEVGFLGVDYIRAMAVARSGGMIYGVAVNENGLVPVQTLHAIDKATGVADTGVLITFQGEDPFASLKIKDIAFGKDVISGTDDTLLYALVDHTFVTPPVVNSELWAIDLATGEATYVVQLGHDNFGAEGLAVVPGDPMTTGSEDTFYTVNKAFELFAQIDFSIDMLDPPPDSMFLNLVPVADHMSANPFEFGITTMSYYKEGDQVLAVDNADNLVSINVSSGEGSRIAIFGYAAARTRVLSRDYNLDGLLDLGEARARGTENYCIDADSSTPNDGGPFSTYPFNRIRLTEDTVAALDASVDWDDVIMTVGEGPDAINFLHSSIILPAGVYADGLAAGGRGLFQLPAPAMDLPIQVKENPQNPISPIYFSDFATAIGSVGETGETVDGFGKSLMSHEWLHVWEGLPDLYDYDVYIDGIENKPVGVWDIMSGAWVHPSPPMKLISRGLAYLGTDHDPWVAETDLRTVLEPWVETEVVMPDYAFNAAKSVYSFTNLNRSDPTATNRIESFYFWRMTHQIPSDPNKVNFSRYAPGQGVMIMHTDMDANSEAVPAQQRIGHHFTYSIIQADGLHELEEGEDVGDAGDPFPGSEAVTTWNEDSDPNSRWYGQVRSGLSITNIEESETESVVTFLWRPRSVPWLEFTTPPGGEISDDPQPKYGIDYDASDLYGGTRVEMYYVQDPLEEELLRPTYADGHLISSLLTSNPQRKSQSGFTSERFWVPLNTLPGDGMYRFYAKLIPGPGQDAQIDDLVSPLITPHGNKGHGGPVGLSASDLPADVDLDKSKLETWTLTCMDDGLLSGEGAMGAEKWLVRGSVSGVQTGLAQTGQDYTSDNDEISFRIEHTGPLGTCELKNSLDVTGDGIADYQLIDSAANFIASEFKAGDVVRVRNDVTGDEAFHVILAVPDTDTLLLATDPGSTLDAVAATYMVWPFSDGSETGGDADRFIFITTGKTPYSEPIRILNGAVVKELYPSIVTDPEDITDPNSIHRVPDVHVTFDGSETRDELGNVNEALEYLWSFGDESADATGSIVEHVYTEPGDYTVTLTVTNPDTGVMGTEEVTVYIKHGDQDGDGVVDTVDNCPTVYNLNQADDDGDLVGNLCDNCPMTENPFQEDLDEDDLGDVCDPDADGDGINEDGDGSGVAGDNPCMGGEILNCDDNCPGHYNPDQQDDDGDGFADDGCDNCPGVWNDPQIDTDGDGVGDECDNCPTVFNDDQANNDAEFDVDGDGIPDPDAWGDVCDRCPSHYDLDQNDTDTDGVADGCDNCPAVWNDAQDDADGDGYGDACDQCPNDYGKIEPGVCGCGMSDMDRDGDGVADCISFDPPEGVGVDSDGDGVTDASDGCPNDPLKIAPGVCGCGNVDSDRDGDGVFDCLDNCPDVRNTFQRDSDLDGIGDYCDPTPGTSSGGSSGTPTPSIIPGCGAGMTSLTVMPMAFLLWGMMRLGTVRRRRRR